MFCGLKIAFIVVGPYHNNHMKPLDFTHIKIFDGAMGTRVLALGVPYKPMFEELNLTQPELIISIHKSYVDAGADFLTTSTFGVNGYKYKNSVYPLKTVILAAIANAKKASNKDTFIVLDIGPLGRMMTPYGDLTFEEATELFKEIILIGKDQVDAVLFETFSDLYELKAGILAAKENSSLPILATMTFEHNGHTLMGTDILTMVNTLQNLGVSALGLNCSLGPVELAPLIQNMIEISATPLIIQPNAGLPHPHADGSVHYTMKSELFASALAPFASDGVSVIGGCCGTDQDTIRELAKDYKNKPIRHCENHRFAVACSAHKTVVLEPGIHIGTNLLKDFETTSLIEMIQDQDFEDLIDGAQNQEEDGAMLIRLDFPSALDDRIDPVELLRGIQDRISSPILIVSDDVETLSKACRITNGIPAIQPSHETIENCLNVLRVLKHYGASLILNTPHSENELAILMKAAEDLGIHPAQIVVLPAKSQ